MFESQRNRLVMIVFIAVSIFVFGLVVGRFAWPDCPDCQAERRGWDEAVAYAGKLEAKIITLEVTPTPTQTPTSTATLTRTPTLTKTPVPTQAPTNTPEPATPVPTRMPTPVPCLAREEYHRGAFDTCVDFAIRVVKIDKSRVHSLCLEFLDMIIEGNWYEQASPAFPGVPEISDSPYG